MDMEHKVQQHGERIAKVEATLAAQDSLLSDFKVRFAKVEEKIDKLWWKLAIVVGVIVGATNFGPDIVSNLLN